MIEAFLSKTLIVQLVLGIILLGMIFHVIVVAIFIQAWLRLANAGFPVPLQKLIALRIFSKIPPGDVSRGYIAVRRAGIDASIDDIATLWKQSPLDFANALETLKATGNKR